MAVVARGVRSARPATAPKHRKTSTPPEPSPPDQPGPPDKSGAARQQDTPAAPDATLELPAVDQPDARDRLAAAAPPGTNARPTPDALERPAAPAPPSTPQATRDQVTAPAKPGTSTPAAASARPDTTAWFSPVKPGLLDRPAA